MGWGENDRGVSFTFGAEVAAKFLHKHDFDLICRAHQVVEDGNYLPMYLTVCEICDVYSFSAFDWKSKITFIASF